MKYKAQLQIQEMAFMLIAVIFLFSLVGLFFLTISYNNMYKRADEIAQARTLSAITSLADSPEFSCTVSKSNCVDADKIIALINNTNFKKFWSFSSLRVMRLRAFSKSEDEMVQCNFANYATCNQNDQVECKEDTGTTINPSSDSTFDTLETNTVSFDSHQGPWGHHAKAPTLVFSDVKEGETIKITAINGKYTMWYGVYPYQDCEIGPRGLVIREGLIAPRIGFYNDNKKLIKEYYLIENEIEVPAGATKLYAYLRDVDGYYYNDDGTCTLTVQILQPKPTTPTTPTTPVDDSGPKEKCYNESRTTCDPDCDVFTIYDKKIKNEIVYSSFVALCRKEYENGYTYDKCEIAKLTAGMERKIPPKE